MTKLFWLYVTYLPFKNAVFDDGLACEVLEHLSKKSGNEMLSELEHAV